MEAEDRLNIALQQGKEEEIREAFGVFYCAVIRLVYWELIQKFGKDDGTDDDVQMAFLSVYQKREKLAGVKSLKRYLIQTALYIAEHRHACEARKDVPDVSEEWEARQIDVPRVCEERRAFEMVNRLLPHPDSDIVIMKAAYGYSEKEIARLLHLGEDAVAYRFRKGMAKVKKAWEGK